MSTDPRVSRSRARIIEVTLDLLATRGVAGTSVDSIAERSGVAKTTIYRHWSTKGEVILAAIDTCIDTPAAPDLGSLRADLRALIGGLCEALAHSRWAALLPSLLDAALRDPEFAEVHQRFAATRTEPVRRALERGIERGELPADTDPGELVDLLSGAVFYRRLLAGESVDRAYGERIVERVLRAYGSH
ncbi:TetR/AcrR family transcriptional regulator [Streptomyces calidiresistens]|uniref:TetR family transcriptional regulator n=1 Tax=Streptomyces calidiresistens TaxID=1485586 RepID=A0A7W3XUU1_9ACTN|nr:TetR/AcrR family transcriptional regulator [Streptomyces calidiresistens]MBB0228054.1 TetR family transcriptional regulator [Streptomyces calidiresistens]